MEVELIALEKVAKIYSGSTLKHPNGLVLGSDNRGYPWVLVEDLHGEQIEHTSRTLSLEEMQGVRVAPPQTVLFSSTGSIGKVGIAGTHLVPSSNLFAVEFDAARVFPFYGMYCLSAMRSEFTSLAKGAVYDSLRLSDFRKFVIPVPALSEQMFIAEKLSTVQKAIGLQQEIISNMDAAILAEFGILFEKEIDAVIRWGEGEALKDCADLSLNGAAKSTQPGSTGVCYISTALLADWTIPYDQIPTFNVMPDSIARFQLHSGDIVMNRINQLDRLGRCGILADEPVGPTVFGQNTLRIRANSQLVEPLFLFAWLRHPFIKQYIQHYAKSSTSFQSSLNKQVLSDLPVPAAEPSSQRAFSQRFKDYLAYVARANVIVNKLRDLQQVWNNRILAFYQNAVSTSSSLQVAYRHKQYWITPSGLDCFYDAYLECIQVPLRESRTLQVSQLPANVDLHFVADVRRASDENYGALHHVRLQRLDAVTVRRDWMQPEAYRPEYTESAVQQQLDDNGLISDQQDFGYLRQSEKITVHGDDFVSSLLEAKAPSLTKSYTRFERLPAAARLFIRQLSTFQQGVYEEFLLAMQPLACHMVHKQMRLRAGKHRFPGHSIQDVLATVQLLERFGLLERKQGLQLDYFAGDSQDSKRESIQDHRGHPVLIDTWTWLLPERGDAT